MVERDRLEGERRVAEEAVLPARAVEVAEPDDRGADLGPDGVDRLALVEVLAAVAVAVDGQQHLRLDLRRSGRTRCAAPNSGAAEDQTAPSDAVARKAAIVSGMFGR